MIFKKYTNARESVEKMEPSYTVDGNVNSCSYGESMAVPQKIRLAIWFSNPTPEHIPRQNYNSKRYMFPYVHSSIIHNSQPRHIQTI